MNAVKADADFKARLHPDDSGDAEKHAFSRQSCSLMLVQTPICLCNKVSFPLCSWEKKKKIKKCPQGTCLLPGASRKARRIPSGVEQQGYSLMELAEYASPDASATPGLLEREGCTVTEQSDGERIKQESP